MLFPIGSAAARVRPPYLTLGLILLNTVIFVATQDRRQEDNRLLQEPAMELAFAEMMIEAEHGEAPPTLSGIMGFTRVSMREQERFWWRWEQGLVVPRSDPQWLAWEEARREFNAARRETLHYRYGFRRDEPTLAGLVGHAFLHGDFGHLLFNMLFLWAVGAAVEDSWGRKWFTLLYVCGILGSVIADFLFMKPGLDIPGIGASGAVAAVMGAMAVRHFRTPMRIVSFLPVPGMYRVATGWLLVPWIAGQFVSFAEASETGSNVGYSAHIGGFFTGVALAVVLRLGRVESDELAPQREAERRARLRDVHLRKADEFLAAGRAPAAIDEFRAALEAEPDDTRLRFRLVEALGLLGRLDEQRSEGIDLLGRLWRLGEKERFALTWEYLSSRHADLPAALAHRVAPLQEQATPIEAARSYARALQQAPDDPLASSSFRRYADLLERLGETAMSAQVRELATAHERRKRDRTLR